MVVVGYGGSSFSGEEAHPLRLWDGLENLKHTVGRLHVASAVIRGVFQWSGRLGPSTAGQVWGWLIRRCAWLCRRNAWFLGPAAT